MHPTREEDFVSSTNKLRRALVLVLAGGSLAIGVPAALAAGGGDSASSGGSAPAAVERFVQDEQAAPDRGDCPERDGGAGAQRDSGTSTPAI
jgi:hypothetical protein